MSPKQPNEETILEQALSFASVEERNAYLHGVCKGDSRLREQLESLIAAHLAAGTFLSGKAVHLEGKPRSGSIVEAAPGTLIGRYKILEKIGEGGMGVVYMAGQEEPVRRKVALKIIKLGMDTRQVVARFEAERQALALMDHPNIAKVLDGGATDAGRPFFVMELVQGVPITEFCHENGLSAGERVRLFLPVCHAIQSAHQKGIIHRDLKPSNILVTLKAGAPHPMVIDFGVAKAIDQKLTEKTYFTHYGTMIGTPAYMSPEQAEMSLDVDTRSDIYSLGVVLYELLTGTTPFPEKRLRSVGFNEMLRIILREEPERPSTRLTQELAAATQVGRVAPRAPSEKVGRVAPRAPSAELLSSEDGARGVTRPTTKSEENVHAASLRSRLKEQISAVRGDLDWIIIKCLEKDRARRYETANGLAQEMDRYLANEPIEARPPGKLYRLGKAVRRNQVAFAAAGVVAVALVLGAVISTWQAMRAKRAEQVQARTAGFLEDMLKSVRPSVALGRDTTLLRVILDNTAARVGKDFKNQPEVEAKLRGIVGGVYSALGDYAKAEAMDRAALSIRSDYFGGESLPVAESLNDLGKVLWQEGKLPESEDLERRALAIREKRLGSENPEVAKSFNDLGVVLWYENNLSEAEPLLRQAFAMLKKLLGDNHADTLESLDNLAGFLSAQNRLQEAEAMQRQSVALNQRLLGAEHPDLAISMNNLADTLNAEGKFTEAEATNRLVLAMRRKLLGNDHPDVAASLFNLAESLRGQGRLAEAEADQRECLVIRRKRLGNDHIDVAGALNNLFNILLQENKLAEAEAAQIEALAIQRKKLPPDHPDITGSLLNLASVVVLENKFAEAEPLQREELSLWRKRLEKEVPRQPATVASLMDAYGRATSTLLADQKFTEAEPLAREFQAFGEKQSPDDWQTYYARALVGGSLLGQGTLSEAKPLLDSGYLGVNKRAARIPVEAKPRINDFLQRIARMYKAAGKAELAGEWAMREIK